MYINTSLKYYRITGTQSHVITKFNDLHGQPSYMDQFQYATFLVYYTAEVSAHGGGGGGEPPYKK